MPAEISYNKAGYRADRWKWVLALPQRDELLENISRIIDFVNEKSIYKTYGLDKIPKQLPCLKKCSSSPWCLSDMKNKDVKKKQPPTESPRIEGTPIGLQNTAYTCWINSALQSLYHILHFRNGINSLCNFRGENSFNSLIYLLQAVFIEMEKTTHAALACSYGNFFEKLAIFATREVLQEDQESEVLKCVSEFLENAIDKLIGDPESRDIFAPMFKIHLFKVAQWCCPKCQFKHQEQMPTETICTMAAYVNGDECPLSQCLLDLQTGIQTGVTLLCRPEEGGCGKTVKADRIVTPKILELPHLLIIRNNSLADAGNRKRQHVVYPDVLNLREHLCEKEDANYKLRSVIFHHGSWVRHFTAHVKTEEGLWFNFNDEFVSRLTGRTNSTPLENNPNYLSLAEISTKYKHYSNVRISRGAFIWIYEKDSPSGGACTIPPPNELLNYILSNQQNGQLKDVEEIKAVQNQRMEFLKQLSVSDKKEDVSVISRKLLSLWATSEEIKFTMTPTLLNDVFCEHGKYDPMVINNIKCIKTSQVENFVTESFGIKCSQFKPSIIQNLKDGLCPQCVSVHAHHILFREKLKELYNRCKKENHKTIQSDCAFIGKRTLELWPKLAASIYLATTQIGEKLKLDLTEEDPEEAAKDDDLSNHTKPENSSLQNKGEDEGEEEETNSTEDATVDSFFNEDIVCPHNLQDPEAIGSWVPNSLVEEIKTLCSKKLHPALLQDDFNICPDCQKVYNESRASIERGRTEKQNLHHLYLERRRPHPSKDAGSNVFLLSRKFHTEWKSYIKACERGNLDSAIPPKSIDNSPLLCTHGKLTLPPSLLSLAEISRFSLILTEKEWEVLKGSYSPNCDIGGVLLENGSVAPTLGICEDGCAQKFQTQIDEERFQYTEGLIYIREVNSESDIPCSSSLIEPLAKRQRNSPKKLDEFPTVRQNRLIRASHIFSSSDTIKEVQNFIAQRTSIWPLLQTLWLAPSPDRSPSGPLTLTDKHRFMTLSSLKVKDQDTIYFRALRSDLEKAAGDGCVEFDEME